jgi:hypothetical protein
VISWFQAFAFKCNLCRYFESVWNYVDLLSISLFCMCISIWVGQRVETS